MTDREAYELTVPADPASLKRVRSHFGPILAKFVGATADDLVLALDEACANVVKHRADDLGDGAMHVRLESGPEPRLLVRLACFCRTEELADIKPRDLADVRPGGLGMHFVSTIMDQVRFEPDRSCPGVLALVMEKSLRPVDGACPGPDPDADDPSSTQGGGADA